MTTPSTPSQTVGPFFAHALPWPDGPFVVAADAPGAIRIAGTVFDGEGQPVPDALVETWQADRHGRFRHPDDPRGDGDAGFRGFGRCPTDSAGHYEIHTVKPGPLPAGNGATEAPHINVSVFARGMLNRLVTRIYFPDEDTANAADPMLASVDDTARRTLVATPESGGLRFDIHLQGEHETAFFTV